MSGKVGQNAATPPCRREPVGRNVTLSPAHREHDEDLVLAHMVEATGVALLGSQQFRVRDTAFSEVAGSSFAALAERGWLTYDGVIGEPSYSLTPAGWLEGLRRSRRLESDLLRGRCQRVVQALRGRLKHDNRSSPLGVSARPDVIATEADVPLPWLLNALDSGLFQAVFPQQQMHVTYERKLIRIPPTFGFPR